MCSSLNFFYHPGEITAWGFIIPEREMLLTRAWNYKSLAAAKRGHLKPVGEWNRQKVTVNGPLIKVELNGTEILNANLDEINKVKPKHKGAQRRSGHICFCGHGAPVKFKNITILELPETE